jgi:hypothetical protein
VVPYESQHADINLNSDDKSLLSQIEFGSSLDVIRRRWDEIHSSAADTEIILKENLALLFREVNILIRQSSK